MKIFTYSFLACLLLLASGCKNKRKSCCGNFSCPEYALDHPDHSNN